MAHDTQTMTRPARWAAETPPAELADNRITVGFDGSLASEAALDWAVTEARVTGAAVLVCHAYLPEHIVRPTPDGDVGAIGAQPALRRLDGAVAAARLHLPADRVAGELRVGSPVTTLVGAATDSRMLVVGTHRYVGPPTRALTSVALRVADCAPCPVVIRPLARGLRGPFAGHVVVGVDGSAPARAALRFGFQHAAAHGLPLAAVHVSSHWPGDFWTDEQTLETHFAVEPAAEALLAAEVEPWHHEFPTVPIKRAAYGGAPVTGLLRAGAGARLLVVGTRGHSALGRLLPSSVSQRVAAHALCPTAVVRKPDA